MKMFIYKGHYISDKNPAEAYRREVARRKRMFHQRIFGLTIIGFGILAQIVMGCPQFAMVSAGIIWLGILMMIKEA